MSTAASERDRAAELAQSDPSEALNIARKISDPWNRAQALAWVARYAQSKMSEIALCESREAAQRTDDTYKQAAVLAWPLRAAIETSQHQLATGILSDANLLLPKVEPLSSRASAAELLLNAVAPANPSICAPLLISIAACCPAHEHWRAKRLHQTVLDFLVSLDGEGSERVAGTSPFSEDLDRTSGRSAPGTKFKARPFFW